MIPTNLPPFTTGNKTSLVVLGTFETLGSWRCLLVEQLRQLHAYLHHVPGFQGAQILLNQHDPGIVVIQSWHASDAYEQAYQPPSIEQQIHGCQHWSLSITWKSYQTHPSLPQQER